MASGPHGAKSPRGGRDCSMSHDEPHWRTNSSFSPALRIWDCRLHSDSLLHGSTVGAQHGSSISSNSRESRSRVGSGRYSNHHHVASDSMLSCSGSPCDNIHVPRWTSQIPKFNLGEADASNAGGSMSQTTWYPHTIDGQYAVKVAASPSIGSPSSLSESNHLESTSKQPFGFSHRNFPSRRPYMSKAVYPLVFRNPVSEDSESHGYADTNSVGKLTPSDNHLSPVSIPDNSSSTEQKFQETLFDLQRSPDPSGSSRREGFRYSSASSHDLGFDGERLDVAENMGMGSLRFPFGPPVSNQKCGFCGKQLWQKSPWSSYRIVKGGDMPIAGVLGCGHVFHAECLEQVTPKNQIHEPPCPLCLKTIGAVEESSSSVSEPLQMALAALRRSRGVTLSEPQRNDETSSDMKDRLRRNWTRTAKRSILRLKGKASKE